MLSVIVLFSPSNTIIEVIHDTKNTCIKVNINIVCPNSSICCLSLKRSERESERERKTKFLQERHVAGFVCPRFRSSKDVGSLDGMVLDDSCDVKTSVDLSSPSFLFFLLWL